MTWMLARLLVLLMLASCGTVGHVPDESSPAAMPEPETGPVGSDNHAATASASASETAAPVSNSNQAAPAAPTHVSPANWLPSGLSTDTDYLLTVQSSGQVLDVFEASTADGAGLDQWPATGAANQRWRFVNGPLGLGIINVGSGKALDVPNGNTTPGTLLQQWNWWQGLVQQWKLVAQPDGSYEIINLSTHLCLDVINGAAASGTAVEEWGCWAGPMQRWSVAPAP